VHIQANVILWGTRAQESLDSLPQSLQLNMTVSQATASALHGQAWAGLLQARANLGDLVVCALVAIVLRKDGLVAAPLICHSYTRK
jgi:hypothetical protein